MSAGAFDDAGQPVELIDGTYGTIVIDPPWPYDTRVSGTRAIPTSTIVDGSRLQRSVAEWTYDAMTLDDIAAMPVDWWAAPAAHLYVWCTNAFVAEAHDLARTWGFTPKTLLTWVKMRHDDPTKPSMKSGWFYRGATEHLVFAQRGRVPKQTSAAYPTAWCLPRMSQHSAKPGEVYDTIAEVSPGPRLDVFARITRPGWVVYGDQVETP